MTDNYEAVSGAGVGSGVGSGVGAGAGAGVGAGVGTGFGVTLPPPPPQATSIAVDKTDTAKLILLFIRITIILS